MKASSSISTDSASLVLAYSLLLLTLIFVMGYTGRDDSHITYFVADAMASGKGIVNYNSDRIEQSSTLLYTSMLALVSKVTGESSALIGPFLSLTFLVLSCLSLIRIFSFYSAPKKSALAVCALPPVIYWSLSGMENSLYLLILINICYSLERYLSSGKYAWAATLLALGVMATLTRPEAFIVIFCVALAIIILPLSIYSRFMSGFFLILSVLVGLSVRYFLGLDTFPNPVYAKQSIYLYDRIFNGLNYFYSTFRDSPLVTLFSFSSFFLTLYLVLSKKVFEKEKIYAVICIFFILAIVSFSFLSGGDWMENGRFLIPVFALQVTALILVIDKQYLKMAFWTIFVVSIFDASIMLRSSYGGIPLYYENPLDTPSFKPEPTENFNVIHRRDASFLNKFIYVLEGDKRDKIIIASRQAGMIPYYIVNKYGSRINFVDLAGLTTNEIHDCKSNLRYNPYSDIREVESCIGVDFDYVYDLDPEGERRKELKDMGCEIVFVDEFNFDDVDWKRPFSQKQFLAICD